MFASFILSSPPQGRLEADQVLVAGRHGKDIDRREGVAGKSNKDRGMLVGMDRCFLGVAIAGVSYLLTPSHIGLSKNVELFRQS